MLTSIPAHPTHVDIHSHSHPTHPCAVRAGGAQLPGAVGHVPVAVSQKDQRGEGGELAGEGALLCRRGEGEGLHFICTPTQPHHTTRPPLTSVPAPPIPTHTSLSLCQWCELVFHSHCTSTPGPPSSHSSTRGGGIHFGISSAHTSHLTLSMCATYIAPLYSMDQRHPIPSPTHPC